MLRILIAFFILPSSLLFSHTFSEKGEIPWGMDSDLALPKKEISTEVKPKKMASRLCEGSIRFFQNYISEIDGPRSTFYPTSSEYAKQMIAQHGVLKGIALGCDRLMRENNERWVYRTIEKHGQLRKVDH